MSQSLETRLLDELNKIVLIDPHSHINPLSPTSHTLADLLGYHYYTELAHSAGMPKSMVEPPPGSPPISDRTKVANLMQHLGAIDNTVQWSWMIELAQQLLGWTPTYLDQSNWEELYDLAETYFQKPNWEEQVLAASGVESIFLTNNFDDQLDQFNRLRYIPCLRTDDLVFHLHQRSVRDRLSARSGVPLSNLATLDQNLAFLFDYFTRHDAKACAISLPPSFAPTPVDRTEAENALQLVLTSQPTDARFATAQKTLAKWTFWRLAELCREYRLPFDLMIGVNRQVYPDGVYQGQDLYDSRVSLIQYAPLFNAFPTVTFPISVLASVTNQELVDYAWIFPNVVTNGHWWYSNTPSFIQRDLQSRLEAIPRTKQIGYYSDAYKLEFIFPKFQMYRRILAKVLSQDFAIQRGWSEESCLALGHDLLRGNIERTFLTPP